jgi:hypothetical protein
MAKNGSETGQTYKVCPGRPPREHQFSSSKQPTKNGRPKGSVSIKAELQKILDMTLKEINPLTLEEEPDVPVGRKIAFNLNKKAAADVDTWSVLKIMEHLDGKPPQDVNLGGQGDDNFVQTVFTLKIDNS